MSVATLVATPDPEPRRTHDIDAMFHPMPRVPKTADTDTLRPLPNRAYRRSMGMHPSAQRGRVARGKYRRHPLGLFVIDGVTQKDKPMEVPS